MQQKRDLAIVLRSIPYEERHRIITALTESHGVISALARNSIQSRRFGGCLEPFAASLWSFVEKPGAELVRLEEATIRRSYEGLRKDFDRLSMASAMNELVLRAAPKQESAPELFRLHANALAYLEESPTAKLTLLNGYLAKLLQWSGSQPQLDTCMGCQVPIEQVSPEMSLNCVVADAGWICAQCRVSETRHIRERQGQSFQQSFLRVTPAAIRDFLSGMSLPIRQVPEFSEASRKEHQDLFKFLEALVTYHLPGFDRTPLKSLRFLDLESSPSLPEGMAP